VGRRREIAEVKSLLAAHRLVTLTGTGGCGKTRLALRVAADIIEEYHDGAWLVDLAPLREPALVLDAVASTLGVLGAPGVPLIDAVTGYVQQRSLLLLLDNCEHLADECAKLVERLLRASPSLRILATSQHALDVPGEVLWRVPPLSVPPSPGSSPQSPAALMQYDAIRLFVERTSAVRHSFELLPSNARAVMRVCRRLDGLPLGIELAAASMKVLTVEQIAARLDDRFRLLTGGARTSVPRHQTLKAAMDWSYSLLAEGERAVLRRLSVCAGGCALDMAEAICAGGIVAVVDVLALLTELVDKSLVIVEAQEEEARYRLLETVRQYAWERLLEAGDAADTCNRHRDWCLKLADQAEPKLRGPEQAAWMERLEAEHDNLRAALTWAFQNEAVEAGLRLAGALYWFWYIRGHASEGRAWLEKGLSTTGNVAPSVRAKATYGATEIAIFQHDWQRGKTLAAASLKQFQDLGDKRGIAYSFFQLGRVALGQDDLRRARRLCERSARLLRKLGDKWGVAVSLNHLGLVARLEGDLPRARSLFEANLLLRRDVGDERGIALSLENLGHMALLQGDIERAAECFREALCASRKVGYKKQIASGIASLGAVAVATGKPVRAARLLGAAEALVRDLGTPLGVTDRIPYDSNVAAIRGALSERAFRAAWAEGQAMTPVQAVEYALNVESARQDKHE
jgi:non-specific serine/threonine protein kinase